MLPILIFNTSIREVIKTPQLFLHFIQHQKLNAEINFIAFMDMHYFGHDLNDNDDDEDMKLPFKKIDGHVHISTGVPAEKLLTVKAVSFNVFTGRSSNYHRFHNNPTYGSLFRPPISLT